MLRAFCRNHNIREIERNGSLKILELFAESVCQAGQPGANGGGHKFQSMTLPNTCFGL
jgi:hypothetical protein